MTAVRLCNLTPLSLKTQLTLLALEETLCRDRTARVGLLSVLSRPIQIVTRSELHNHTRLVLNKMPSSVRTALSPRPRNYVQTYFSLVGDSRPSSHWRSPTDIKPGGS